MNKHNSKSENKDAISLKELPVALLVGILFVAGVIIFVFFMIQSFRYDTIEQVKPWCDRLTPIFSGLDEPCNNFLNWLDPTIKSDYGK